jgi:hypothetical protein
MYITKHACSILTDVMQILGKELGVNLAKSPCHIGPPLGLQ